jgi:hypothetical protein
MTSIVSTGPNPYPWPSITNFSYEVDDQIRSFLTHAAEASSFLAKSFYYYVKKSISFTDYTKCVQEYKSSRAQVKSMKYSKELHDFFCQIPSVATEKFDGTNIGITSDGLVLGRRHIVLPDLQSYQKTSLEPVKLALPAVSKVKEKLMQLLPQSVDTPLDGVHTIHCTIYGELMCNKHLFDYSARNLAGGFETFGVMLRCLDSNVPKWFDSNFVDVLRKNGYCAAGCWPNDETTNGETKNKEDDAKDELQCPTIKVFMCTKLIHLFQDVQLSSPSMKFEGTLVDMIQHLSTWMNNGDGEGVVITVAGGRSDLKKWKSATEFQGRTPDLLKELCDYFETLNQKQESHRQQLLDARIVQMVHTMYTVSISDCNGRSAVAMEQKRIARKKEQLDKPKVQRQNAIPEEVLRDALTSALTKYDSIDTWIKRDGKDAVIAELFKEVCEDLDVEHESGKMDAKGACAKMYISKYVGQIKIEEAEDDEEGGGGGSGSLFGNAEEGGGDY